MSTRAPAYRKLRATVALAVLAGVALAGCVTEPDGPDGPVDVNVETIAQGSYGQGPERATDQIILQPVGWDKLWQTHAERAGDATSEAPAVDFEDWFVVYAYAGEKNTGGHQVTVTAARYDQGTYTIQVQDVQPGDDCIVTEALTYPYHLARIERVESGTPKTVIEHEEVVVDCGDDNGGDDGGNGNGDTTVPADETGPVVTLEQGNYAQGPAEPEDRVITNQSAYDDFWQTHRDRRTGYEEDSAQPQVDFSVHFVVFAYAGQKNTGGHAIVVDNVTFTNGTYTITVQDIRPGPTCVNTQAIEHPYHLVRIERSQDGGGTPSTEFVHDEVVQDCG